MRLRHGMRIGLGVAVVAGLAVAQDLAGTLDALKVKLNQDCGVLVDEYQTQRVGLEDEYLQVLRKVETDYQTNGWLRGSMALYDEHKRFTKTRLLPPPPRRPRTFPRNFERRWRASGRDSWMRRSSTPRRSSACSNLTSRCSATCP